MTCTSDLDRDAAEECLAALQKQLAGRVAALRLATPADDRPFLEVTGRSGMTERVFAETVGGGWWFCWARGSRICPADDPVMAARRVLRVVAVVG